METASGSTPPSLLQRARDQDEAAWALLVAWASDAVLACCRQAGLQQTDRDDIFQRVFLRAWQNLATFERRTSFRSWVRVIARNQILDLFRSRKRADDILARFAEQAPKGKPNAPAGEDPDANEVKDAVALWLGHVKKRYQNETGFLPFCRMAIDELPAAAVAAEFGIEQAAVRKYKFRWLKRLRQEFADAFGEVLPPDAAKRPGWPL